MKLQQIFYKTIKETANLLEFDITRRKNNPSMTLLGLCRFPFKTIIDVGANTGQFARMISEFYPNAKLYCFEPLPDPFDILLKWSKDQKETVVPFNLAIGEKNGDLVIYHHEDHTPSSSFLKATKLNGQLYPITKKQKQICVRQTTLDSVFEASNIELLPNVLIKVDVQGYEDRVIIGGKKTFLAASACILEVCLDKLYEGQTEFKELLMMLHDIGFRYAGNLNQTYGDDGHCIFLDAVFLKKEELFNN